MSTPILDLDGHEGGAQASIRFVAMNSGERLHFLSAAVAALFTGNALVRAPHASTLHRGHRTRLSFDDRPCLDSGPGAGATTPGRASPDHGGH